MNGTSAADVIVVMGGSRTIDNTISGGVHVTGDASNDRITGTDGADQITGEDGIVQIFGGDDDTHSGGVGNDGNDGNDGDGVLFGGFSSWEGFDVLDGGLQTRRGRGPSISVASAG